MFVRLLLVTALALTTPGAVQAQGLLRGFIDEPVAGGLVLPVTFATLPDGTRLVAEKPGVVRVVRHGVVLPDAFLDLRERVNDYWDRGLLGLAVDPAFATNGFVYLYYVYENDPLTYSGPKASRLVRVTATGDTASLASEVVLLDGIPADSASHNGGALAFGPDGALWVTTGDAASFNAVDPLALRTQNLDSPAGKLLRIGVDGRGRPDNPFWTGDPDAWRSKVWAYGFRNPFRLTFRPATGRPYIADVGANDWEEVNAVGRGGNHGWPCLEGPAPQAGYQALAECQALYGRGPSAVVMPVASYAHAASAASIAGGAFYDGTMWPEQYRGAYLFGDFARGLLHYVAIDGADTSAGHVAGLASGIDGVVDVRVEGDALLYLSVTRGELRRLRYVPDTGLRQSLYLSDAVAMVTAASNGLGPIERDRSHGGAAAGDGGPLSLGGRLFAKGLGVHAPSDVRVGLGGTCTAFTASVGIDDETGGGGSVTFEVWLDGVRVVASGVMRGGVPPFSGTLDLTGRQELRLVVTDGGDGAAGDHADWAEARLDCVRPGGDTAPPQVVSTTPAADATGVAATASVAAGFSEDLQATSVGPATMTVVSLPTETPVAGVVSHDAATRRVIFTPALPLAPGVTYRATIDGVRDLAALELVAPVSWTFTTAPVETNQAPAPLILLPAPGATFAVGEVLPFSGTASDVEDGPLAPGSLRWTVSIRHCPGGVCHTHPLVVSGGSSGAVVAPEHGADSFLVVTLTATDSGGRATSVSREIRPQLVTVTLRTEPPGLPVIFGETRRLSPATFDAVVGSRMNVATLTPQHSLSFTGWDSGRPVQHTLTIGVDDVVDTARFAPAAGVYYLSDLSWTSATSGAGPVERDRAHGDGLPGDGPPLTLRGVTYAKGLGVLANADVRIALGGACTAFAARVGIDDDVQGGGSALAGVLVDGRLAWASGRLNGALAPESVVVDVSGAAELALVVVDGGDGNLHDEVDWADARLSCLGPGAATPASPTSLSALAFGQTAGLWWAPVPGATSYRLEAGSAPGLTNLGVFDLTANVLSAAVPNGAYWVRVRAINAWGTSAATPDTRLVVDGSTLPPAAPLALAAGVNGRTVTLVWTPPVTGGLPAEYLVEAGTDVSRLVTVARSPQPAFSAAGVPPGTYVVRVRAVNAAGTSSDGPTVTVVVP